MLFVPRHGSRTSAATRPVRRVPGVLLGAVLLLVAGLLVPVAARAATADHLLTGQRLTAGQQLAAAGGRYRLVLQTDGNLVLYTAAGRAAWATATTTGADLQVQADGNLVLYSGSTDARTAVWNTGTPNDTLGPGQSLTPGDVLVSGDGRVRWTLATSGDAVLTGGGRTLWRTGTAAAAAAAGAQVVMQADGNLVLYDGAGRPLWSSGTNGRTGAMAVVRSGRLEVVQAGVAVWASPGTDTLTAGQTLPPGTAVTSPSGSYALTAQTDGNLVLYGPGGASWATGTSGAARGLTLQTDGNLVLYSADGRATWWSGTGGTAPGVLRMQDDAHLVLYAASGAAVWSMWARSPGLDAAVAAAAAFGAASGERTGVAVLDRTTGLVYGAGDVGGAFASASVVKVFIAARLLSTGAQADPATADLMYRMVTRSDDAAATALWPRAGGAGVTDWVQARYGIGGLGHPTQAGWWGLTQISALAMVQFYAAVAADPAVGPWLMNAMANAANIAADGWNQWFGIPSATTGWRVKQGWMCCLDSRSRLHSTGFVGGDRYTVAILTDGPTAFYGQRGADVVTGAALRLLPNGRVPA